ncbi:MAG TPA: cytochrome C oxidase subunit IV family protein [Candidatus Sulfotelmatobacter sp.]|jgi:heme/copper-type cytochrome/quinol oxidase subunit 4
MTTDAKTGSMGKDVAVYICLLVLAAIQFVIGYQNISDSQKLLWMLIVALIEAAVALLFFMHLTDNKGLRWFVLVFGVSVILGMQYGWTDSFRVLHGVPWAR